MATAKAPAAPPTNFIAPAARGPAGAIPVLGVGEALESVFDGAFPLAPDAVGFGVGEAEAEAGEDAPLALTRVTT